jgi:hypothetical protein
MTSHNGQEHIQPIETPDTDIPQGQLAVTKRMVERGWRAFCEKRGLDPDGEGLTFRERNRAGWGEAAARRESDERDGEERL